MLPLQPWEVQLPEMQVLTCLQPLFQKGSQCAKLQGRKTCARHNRRTLTTKWRSGMQGAPIFEEGLQGAPRFFWETQEEFSFIMAA